jgi:predicted dienelactone hydrolase
MNMKTFSKLKILCNMIILLLVSAGTTVPADAQNVDTLPLAEPGPYMVGTREMIFVEANRNAREIATTLWYPAHDEAEDAAPNLNDAPYPLILYTYGQDGHRKELEYLTQHLASYGFVVAAMEQKDNPGFSPPDVVDRPLDVLFVLDQLSSLSTDDFDGVIDTNHAGVTGYSFGGYTSVAVSGAQWDDSYHMEWCANHADLYPRACPPISAWDQINVYRAQIDPQPSEGDLWLPFSDERIKAVLPIAGSPGPVFGERGLASATIPMLLMAATADRLAPYEWTGIFLYEHWGSSERYLLSFIDAGHQFGYTSASRYKSVILHFATAFFGYYLQGQADYAQYLTEDYVNGIDGLAWGPYGDAAGMFNLMPMTPDNVDQIEQLTEFEQSTVCTATFSPNGELLASSGSGTVSLWDITDPAVINTLSVGNRSVRSLAFSADGTLVAATSTGNCGDTRVGVWDVATGELLLEQLDDFEHMATGVAISPDSSMVAAGTGCVFDVPGSAFVKVWDIASGILLLDIPLPSFVMDVAISPDGTLLAAAAGDGIIRLWELGTGTLHSELHVHSGIVSSIAFSPDGTRLVSGGADTRLWDVASGEQLYLFEGPAGEVVDVAFSADGRLVVTGGGSHTLVFWDTATGAPLAVREVDVADNFVGSVAFNADSTLLATCEHDQMFRLWGVQGQ